jgi:hypothetical protein
MRYTVVGGYALAKSSDVQRKWALVGAEARLKEVQAEIAEIYRVFPELRSAGRAVNVVSTEAKSRQFSSKGKAAISEGMRKYWARRKAAAAKAAKASPKN